MEIFKLITFVIVISTTGMLARCGNKGWFDGIGHKREGYLIAYIIIVFIGTFIIYLS